MAGNKIENAPFLARDWNSEIRSKNLLKRGFYSLEFDVEEYPGSGDFTSRLIIKVGSSVDIDGVMYIFNQDEYIDCSSYSTYDSSINRFIYLKISGGETTTVTVSETADIYWDDYKRGWYDASDYSRIVLYFNVVDYWRHNIINNKIIYPQYYTTLDSFEAYNNLIKGVSNIDIQTLSGEDIFNPVKYYGSYMESIDESIIREKTYLCGEAGTISISLGNETQTRVFGTYDWKSISRIGSSSVYCCVGNGGAICRSTDEGNTWDYAYPASSKDLNFIDNNIAVGDRGTICRSTNNGANWSTVSSGTTEDLFYVKTSGIEPVAIALGDGGIICRSTNNGASWSTIHTGGGDMRSMAHMFKLGNRDSNSSISLLTGDSVYMIADSTSINPVTINNKTEYNISHIKYIINHNSGFCYIFANTSSSTDSAYIYIGRFDSSNRELTILRKAGFEGSLYLNNINSKNTSSIYDRSVVNFLAAGTTSSMVRIPNYLNIGLKTFTRPV